MMRLRSDVRAWLTDMDGVLVHEGQALPGAADFLQRLVEKQRRFLVLTNNSIFTPRDLAARLARSGLIVNVPVSASKRFSRSSGVSFARRAACCGALSSA